MEFALAAGGAALLTVLLNKRKQERAGQKSLSTKLGKNIRAEFPTDFSYTHLNHGSYGVAPKAVMREARKIMYGIEAFPDDFFRRTALPRFKAAADEIAKFVGAEPGSVVFVENATVGVNTVLRSFPFQKGDAILINDNTYNAVKNAVIDRANNTGASVVTYTVPLELPASGAGELLVRQFASVLDANPSVKLAIVDHITSPTAVVMPIAGMAREAHARGVKIMVDGAHAPGQLPLVLSSTGVDWYTGNLHKWCYSLKGAALLYCAKDVQDMTQGPVISHFWKQPLANRFYMQGTNDQSRYLSTPFALAWVQDVLGGWPAVREYNSTLANMGADLICKAWGTGRMIPSYMCAPFLIVLEMPLDWRVWARTKDGRNCVGMSDAEAEDVLAKDDGFNERVATALFQGWRIQGQTFAWRVDGRVRLWTRISAQVYNCIEDYQRLAQAVLDLKKQTQA